MRRYRFLLSVLSVLFGVPFYGSESTQAATPQQIEVAIANGLAYLAPLQQGNGSWENEVAYTGLVVLKFEDRARELGFAPTDPAYPYYQRVVDGLSYIAGQGNDIDISSEPAADGGGKPGIGTCFGTSYQTYHTGIALMALAASRQPGYKPLVQDALDWMSFAQNNPTCGVHRGGWGYGANDCSWSDGSNAGYATLGLGYAAASPPLDFGLTIPQFVKDELTLWIDTIQDDVNSDPDDGGSWYNPDWVWNPWVNILKTGNLIYEMGLVGDTAATGRVQDAVDYIERHWNDAGGCGTGWKDHRQAMFTMMKGLVGLDIKLIDTDSGGVGPADDDWFDEVSTHLVTTQNLGGSWPPDCYANQTLSTAWALLTLEKAVPVVQPIGQRFCIVGSSTGVSWTWWLTNGMTTYTATVATPAGDPATAIAAAWATSMVGQGLTNAKVSGQPHCFKHGITPPTGWTLTVQTLTGPVCTVTQNGCSFNPTVIEVLDTPIPTVSTWGLVVLTLLLLVGAKIYFGHRRRVPYGG